MGKRLRRLRKILLIMALLFVVAGVGVRLYFSPRRVRLIVQRELERATASPVEVGYANFSIFTGAVLRDVRIQESAEDPRTVLSVHELRARPDYSALLRGSAALTSLRVEGVRVNVELDESFHWPFLERLPRREKPARPAALPFVSLTDVQVRLSSPQVPAMEWKGLQAWMMPVAGVPGSYGASLQSPDGVFGRLLATATFHLDPLEVAGDVALEDVKLTPQLAAQFPAAARVWWERIGVKSGSVDATAKFSLTADGFRLDPALATLNDAAFAPPELPYAFKDASAKVWFTDNTLTLGSFSASAGDARLSGRGELALRKGGKAKGDLRFRAEGIALDDTLQKALPAAASAYWSRARPSGAVNAQLDLAFSPERARPRFELALELLGVSLAPAEIPINLRELTGRVKVDEERVRLEDITGVMGGGAVKMPRMLLSLATGRPVQADLKIEKLNLDYKVKDLLKAPELRAAMPPEWLGWLERAEIAGQLDVSLKIEPPAAGVEAVTRADVAVREMTLVQPDLGFPVKDLETVLHYTGKSLEMDRLTCTWKGAPIEVDPVKAALPLQGGGSVSAHVRGLKLDEGVRGMLPPGARNHWDRYSPAGLVDGDVTLDWQPGKRPPVLVDAAVRMRDGRMMYGGFPYPAHSVTGQIIFKRNVFQGIDLSGRNGRAYISLQVVGDDSREGWMGREIRIQASAAPLDADLYKAIPRAFKAVWDQIQPTGTIRDLDLVIHRYRQAEPRRGITFFDADATLRDVEFARGPSMNIDLARIVIERAELEDRGAQTVIGAAAVARAQMERVPLTDLTLHYEWRNGALSVNDLVADCFDGALTASMYLSPRNGLPDAGQFIVTRQPPHSAANAPREGGGTPETPGRRFFGKLSLYNASLERILRQTGDNADLSGRVSAFTNFAAGNDQPFRANGAMTVYKGRIGELPGFLSVLNLFVLNELGAPVFNTLEVAYEIRDQNLIAHSVLLMGDLMSLTGTGRVEDGGAIRFDFVPTLGPRLPRIPGISRMIDVVKGMVVSISVGGDYNDPVFRINPLVPVTRLLYGIISAMIPNRPAPETPAP